MRLESVEIRDFRSLFIDGSGAPFLLEFGHGANTLVGQNNCGKSNVLRAISLALDPAHDYDSAVDPPGPRPFAHPIITLTFEADGTLESDVAPIQVIRRFAAAAGIQAAGDSPLRFGLQVAFVPSGSGVHRHERLLFEDGEPKVTEHSAALQLEAIAAVRSAVRFVLISTGESIESVMEGNFREILHSVVRDRLRTEFEGAERSRTEYVQGLQDSLLGPLRTQLADDVRQLFPEIEAIGLAPKVSSIEQTLSQVGVSLDDAVSGPLAHKGTGVRGGVMVAMLSYLALNATRSMVFAVEEPEAFLHPAAQEDLRDHLERVAEVAGVTLLVTTHSPFIVSRSKEGRVFCLAKDRRGRTRLAESASGDSDHAPLIGGLLREASIEEVLASAVSVPAGTKAVVLVEGEGDIFCLRLAAEVLDRHDLLDGLLLRVGGGTIRMKAQAVLTKAAVDVPLVLVVDNDQPGQEVKKTLVGRTWEFNKNQVISYADAFDEPQWKTFPVEAEDVFAPDLLKAFVEDCGEDDIIVGKTKRPDGAWHYDLDQSAKQKLSAWLAANTKPHHLERWVRVIQQIRTAAKLGQPSEVPSDVIAAATKHRPAGDLASETSGTVLVLADATAYRSYQEDSALLVGPEVTLPSHVTHIGFYDRGIHPEVPKIISDHPNLLISEETCQQLRSTGRQEDLRVAAFVERLIASGDITTGEAARLLLLSTKYDGATLTLDGPVANTKRLGGKPVAWAPRQKEVPYRALAQGPATTDELDELAAKMMETQS